VGDMTGFAAACYQRGVHFVQVPTTVMAQVSHLAMSEALVSHPGRRGSIRHRALHSRRVMTGQLQQMQGKESSLLLAEGRPGRLPPRVHLGTLI
jgi:hypothetical protein